MKIISALFTAVLLAPAARAAAPAGDMPDAYAQLRSAFAAEAPAERDTRIDYPSDDSDYPRTPVRRLFFSGFGDAKTSSDPYEESLCRRDAAALQAKVREAAVHLGVPAEDLSVSDGIDRREERDCSGPRQGRGQPSPCRARAVFVCALRLTSDAEGVAFLYKRYPDVPGRGRSACEAQLEGLRSAGAAVVDSNIVAWRRKSIFKAAPGCALQTLQVVRTTALK